MKIFNHLLLRISALPYEVFNLLPATHLNNTYSSLLDAEEEIHLYKNFASGRLLSFNQNHAIAKNQQIIQNVRKKIFQLKPLKEEEILFFNSFPEEIQDIVLQYNKMQFNAERLKERFLLTHKDLVEKERKNIQELSHHEIFLKGIALSSHILYRDIVKYQSKHIAAFKSDELHTEKSVLKYLTRIVTKTSPFSTFTNIGHASISELKQKLYTIQTGKQIRVKSSFTISASLVNDIKNKAMASPYLTQYLPVRLNKTLQKKNSCWTFVAYSKGNHEFKSITNHYSIKLIIQTLATDANQSLILLSKRLAKAFGETEENTLRYLDDLTELGLFEYLLDTDLSQKKWFRILDITIKKGLRAASNTPAETHFKDLLHILHRINKMFTSFPNLTSYDRIQELQHLKSDVDGYLYTEQDDAVHAPSIPKKKLKIEKIIYEDTNISCNLKLSKTYVNSFAEKILRLFKSLQILEQRQASLSKAHKYFCFKYPKRNTVPLLDFYEDYFKDILYPELNGREESKPQHFLSFKSIYSSLNLEGGKVSQWKKLFVERLSDINTDSLNISVSEIENINKQLGIRSNKLESSVGVFIQPVFNSSQNQITVVNAMYGSYGKMYSRFLKILPEKIKNDLREDIYNNLNPYGKAVELNDPSLHNANIYPKILIEQVSLPGGRSSHPENQQIQLSQILIKRNTRDKSLSIIDKKTGRKLLPIDFGFQAADFRIELFRFLNMFSPVSAVSHTNLLDIINGFFDEKAAKDNSPFLIMPRIIVENDIVLQRKTWTIPPALQPLRDNNEDDAGYFKRIQEWKAKFKMPQQIFVKRRRSDMPEKNDDYKPQFIDLHSPLNVSLFEKSIMKNRHIKLFVEEALPAPENSMLVNKKHFSTEFFIQINS